jgi:hypothetical protein
VHGKGGESVSTDIIQIMKICVAVAIVDGQSDENQSQRIKHNKINIS